MARPQKITDEQLIKAANKYLEDCNANKDIPIVREFALQVGLCNSRLYERALINDELSSAIKRISDTKQVVLEKGALTGKFNPTMAIFSLKQMGWSDHKDDPDEKEEDDNGVIMMPEVKKVKNGK